MRSKRNRAGFTMVEALVVVAIVTILGGIGIINLIRYQRSLKQLELNEAAKEVFVAAQNHLSMANSQGLLPDAGSGSVALGMPGGAEEPSVYYLASTEGNYTDDRTKSVLPLLLPFGSVDEWLRKGEGSYVIRYDPVSATVLDVFYMEGKDLVSAEGANEEDVLAATMARLQEIVKDEGDDQQTGLRPFVGSDTKVGNLLGRYRADDVDVLEGAIAEPAIRIVNSDTLTVEVSNDPRNKDMTLKSSDQKVNAQLRLVVKGVDSGEVAYFDLMKKQEGASDVKSTLISSSTDTDEAQGMSFKVVLDDITDKDTRFVEMTTGVFAGLPVTIEHNPSGFIPGENLQIWAEAFSTNAIANIAQSTRLRTNSLFASVGSGEDGHSGLAARIRSFRHLENLDPRVSNVVYGTADGQMNIDHATQLSNLNWKTFVSNIQDVRDACTYDDKEAEDDVCVYRDGVYSNAGTYWPVELPVAIASYNGHNHVISYVKVDVTGDAGLFSTVPALSTVKNLVLAGFDITSTGGDAGALAGGVAVPEGPAAVEAETEEPDATEPAGSAQDEEQKDGEPTEGHEEETESGTRIVAVLARDATSVSVRPNDGSAQQESDLQNQENSQDAQQGQANQGEQEGAAAPEGADNAEEGQSGAQDSPTTLLTTTYARVKAQGNAGGIVGAAYGCTIEGCAASVEVESSGSGNAGGLVGKTVDTDVCYSYAAGHTKNGTFEAAGDANAQSEAPRLDKGNVRTRAGAAGGLIGSADGGSVEVSYATCSVTGQEVSAQGVGGLIGSTESKMALDHCYTTGYVQGMAGEGATAVVAQVVGKAGGTDEFKKVYYDNLVNGSAVATTPVLGGVEDADEELVDLSSSRQLFSLMAPFDSRAVPNDGFLKTLYHDKYEFRTVDDLYRLKLYHENGNADEYLNAEEHGIRLGVDDGAALADDLKNAVWLYTHRGDWPASEQIVVNEKS